MAEAVQILIGGVLQGCIFALLAVGFSLIYRVASAINLAQGGFCIVAALLTSTLQESFGLPVIAAGLLGVAGTAVLALVLGAAVFVPGLKRLPTSSMFILTAGVLTFLEGGSLVIWGSQSYTLPAFSSERPIVVLGLLVPSQGIWLVAITAAITSALSLALTRTRLGRAFRACAENPMAASLMGIGVGRMQLLSFVLAAAIGAVGGIVIGPITSFEFDTGRMYTIFGFIAAVIGGIASPLGAVVGGLCLGVATQLAAAYVSSLFSNALALVLLLVILLWRPSGLFSAGPARRQDVREEPRVHRALVRLGGRSGWLLAACGAVVLLVLLPWSLQSSGLMSSVIITLIVFLSVLGLDVLMGFTGQVSLGQAGFMAIGGYTASVLAVNYGVPPLLGTLAGLALSLICAAVLAVGTMRLRGLYLAIATLAFSLLVDSLTVGLDGVTGGPSGLVGIPSFSIGPLSFATPLSNYYLLAFILVVVLVLLTGGMRGGFGRALQAIRADPLAAAALGVNVPRYKVAVFCISAALGSLSGSLYAFYFHFLSPDMVGTPLSLQMLAMLVVGGEGTLFGPLFGVAILTLLPTVFQPLAQFKTMGSGLLLVLFSLYLPSGIFGVAVATLAKARRRSLPVQQPSRSRMTTVALEIDGLSKSFGGVQAVEGVSFGVPEASVTALIGPNGAGKTTLFNLITHLLPASAGTVHYFGQSIAGLTPDRIATLGLVRAFQTARVFPGMTVLENVMVGAQRLMRIPAFRQMLWSPAARREEVQVRARAETLLDVAGLLVHRDRAANELPMGAQKLLEVIRALMAAPRLLLLDEPAAGLNDTETAELSAMLRAIRSGGVTVLVVEHNMSLVMGVADQIVVLDAGRTIAIGSPDEIRSNRAVIEAYVGREGA